MGQHGGVGQVGQVGSGGNGLGQVGGSGGVGGAGGNGLGQVGTTPKVEGPKLSSPKVDGPKVGEVGLPGLGQVQPGGGVKLPGIGSTNPGQLFEGDLDRLLDRSGGTFGQDDGATIRVGALHPSPFRFAAYLDRSQLAELGLPDVVNHLYGLPAEGFSTADVQRVLFGQPGVASTQRTPAACTPIRDSIVEFLTVFFELKGFTVYSALDGETGLNLAAHHRPAVILCDMRLGEMDGADVFRGALAGPAITPVFACACPVPSEFLAVTTTISRRPRSSGVNR